MKRINNKGFMVAGVVYSILLLFVIIIAALLTLLSNRKTILDSTNSDIKNEINDVVVEEGSSEESNLPSIKDKIVENNSDGNLVTVGDDLRFRGATVNNYVTFNDESWRIIGFVNDKIKLIKTTPLVSTMAWNSNGTNDWTTASLQEYLNGEYYNGLTPDSKNMIETVTYKLGGINSTNNTVDRIYVMENGSDVFSGRPQELTNTKIALMYPSDYGYSMSTSCTQTPYNYDTDTDSACRAAGTWLYNGGKNEWLLTPSSTSGTYSSLIMPTGYLHYVYKTVQTTLSVRPTLYLKSNVKVSEGDGTEGSPYTLIGA